jgi:predicted O-methyltransferase YrrM
MTSRDTTPLLTLRHEGNGYRPTLSDRAHVLAYGAIGWPWLLKSLYGGTKAARQRLEQTLELDPSALPNLGSWKADAGFLQLLADHILSARPKTVVEFGAGATSLVAARALQLNGEGRLYSFDQHAQFIAATRLWLQEQGLEAVMKHAPLKPSPGGWPGLWYDHGPLPDRIDLLLIDGPPWTIHPFVRGAAEELFDRIVPGGMVMLDDAARPGERVVARRWRRRWPGFSFRLSNAGTKGTLIGIRHR